MLVLDEGLAEKLKFVKEGQFVEKDRAGTLKPAGDVVPIEKVEVVKRVKEHLTEAYPLSVMQLLAEVKNTFPGAKDNHVWDVIRDNEMKANLDYSKNDRWHTTIAFSIPRRPHRRALRVC